MAKKARNPFAVCRALQKRRGWSKTKFKHCAEKIKRSLSMGKKK